MISCKSKITDDMQIMRLDKINTPIKPFVKGPVERVNY